MRFAPAWELRFSVPARRCARRIAIFTRAPFDRVRRKAVPLRVVRAAAAVRARPTEKRRRVKFAEVITGATSGVTTGGSPVGPLGVTGGVGSGGGGGAGAGAGGWNS